MARSPSTKTEIKLTVNIKPVKLTEVTPTQRQLVKKFYKKLIADVKAEERCHPKTKGGDG